jgi:phosphoribosyl-ATP pyrophosphohydrolase/phosphoribosyl-AMP cyclohydrolase
VIDPNAIDFAKGNGLVSVVAQDATSGAVLMVAFANREAVERSVATGELHFFSRRRGLWKKGETSGNTMRLVGMFHDCDADTILARVVPAGPACHTGQATCFGHPVGDTIGELERSIAARASSADAPDEKPSYTRRLLADRNLRLKKIGEEASELVVALADGDRTRVVEEAADVVYHLLVAIQASGVSFDEVREVLASRATR